MPEFELTKFISTFDKIREKAIEEGRITENPPVDQMRALVENEPGVKKTIYGNYVAESEPTSRSAMFTKNSVDTPFGDEELKLLEQCEAELAKHRLICTDRIVPERFAHVAYGGGNLFWPVQAEVKEPDYRIVFFFDDQYEKNWTKPLPEKDITIRLAMLPDGKYVKIIRNGNYIGEYKKGVFAAEDWAAKTRNGGIFLHLAYPG